MSDSTPTPPKPKIMVVDDTAASLRHLEEMLSQQGYAVRAFPIGRMALAAAPREMPDLILLDIQMPEMNGYEVCECFKANPALAAIPVIFISAQQEPGDKARGFAAGGVDYVTKPFQFEEVEARVRTHLELRRQKLALQQSFERLTDLEQLRDNLVHMVVHDMRSPLFAIIMALDLLKINVPNPTEKATKYMEMVGSNVTKLTEMVNQLLDISRLESGRMPLQKTRNDLAATAHSVLDALNAVKADRLLILHAPHPVFAHYDQEVVGRILTNLVGNALKFTVPNDTVKISVEKLKDAAKISVTDHGPGVPDQYRSSIFEKFTQVEGEKRKFGTGLGLTFCKLAVEAHGGSIGVESTPALENTFWFTLPLATV